MTTFQPKFMRVGVLTAALQELTPRDVRDADPDRAVEDWLQFALEIGASYIQLSAALHPSQADVPPDAMLDPVANTLDLRKPKFQATAAYGHFGRSGEGFTWENTDKAAALKAGAEQLAGAAR